jgi:segregation and condensation protein B
MATEATKAIEAILMVAQEPVDPHLLAQLLEVSPDRVSEMCDELQAAYARDDRGFVLVKVAGGYRFQSHGDMAPYVERFVLEGQSARLSSAALETLAIVAYKQPISRAQVAAIRGVNVDGVMRTLQQRGYIDEVGRDPGPGQATLFGTTTEFLERLGLNSLQDLPAIAELFPDASVLEALEKGLRVEPTVEPGPEAEAVSDATDEVGADPDGPDHDDGAATEAAATPASDGEPELPSWFTSPVEGAGATDAASTGEDPTDEDPTDEDPPGEDRPGEPSPDDHA